MDTLTVATEIAANTSGIAEMEPGNFTKYRLVWVKDGARRIHFGVVGMGCAILPWDLPVHWTYTAEKLRLTEGDAVPITDMLNMAIELEKT